MFWWLSDIVDVCEIDLNWNNDSYFLDYFPSNWIEKLACMCEIHILDLKA